MRTPSDLCLSRTILRTEEMIALGEVVDCAPQGDVVICGTMSGGDAIFMSEGNNRHIVVIDSFEGLSLSVEQDSGTLSQNSFASASDTMDILKRNIGGRLELYKMWITPQNLLQRVHHRPTAVLWMDLDLYEPTQACLDYFVPDLVPGGVALCHDYTNPHTPGVIKALKSTHLKWEGLSFGITRAKV